MSESNNPHPAGNDGNYVVVARRYRPRGFDELVGQDPVARALTNAIQTSRVGHAYLFTGARGVGKTSTARIFAKALNDPSGPTATPDNTSDVALAIDSGEDVDVIEIDGASNRGIDEIRSLRANVGVRPSRSRFKIYIIDEVHMLTGAAFNALLKTLEEPPEHVKFIFCTTDPEKIPITVLSRCQRFDFAPVEVSKIVTRLREIITAESATADDAALELIARRAAGSMRDSQSLLEQVLSFSDGNLTSDQVHAMLGTADDERLHSLAKAMADRDAAAAMRQLDAGIDAGVDAGRLAEQLLGYFRDLMAVTVGCDPSLMRHTSASLHSELKELGGRWGLQTVLAVVGLIDQTLVRIRHSVYARVLLEATLIQICSLPDLQKIANLAAAAETIAASTPAVAEKKKRPVNSPPAEHQGAEHQDAEHQDAEHQGAEHQGAEHQGAEHQGAEHQGIETRSTEPQSIERQNVQRPRVDTTPDPVPTVEPEVFDTPLVNNTALVNTVPPLETAASLTQGDVTPSSSSAVAILEPVTSTSAADEASTMANGATGTKIDAVVAIWDQPTAQRVWRAALSNLESMTETFARVVEKVVVSGDQKLKLVFPAEASLAMKRCELPEHKSALVDAVSRSAGRPIALEFEAAPPKRRPQKVESTANRPSKVQRMREIEANELVKSCVELFNAEIVRIEKPR